MSFSSLSVGCYAMAYGLVGFGRKGARTHLRVKVERLDSQHVWVRTADLRDAGTPLVLRPDQVEVEWEV